MEIWRVLNDMLLNRAIVIRNGALRLESDAFFSYNIADEEYLNLITALKGFNINSAFIGSDYFHRWGSGYSLFVAENIRRDFNLRSSFTNIEKIINCELSSDFRKNLLRSSLTGFWRRIILLNENCEEDLWFTLLAESGQILPKPKSLLSTLLYETKIKNSWFDISKDMQVNDGDFVKFYNTLCFYKKDLYNDCDKKYWASLFHLCEAQAIYSEFKLNVFNKLKLSLDISDQSLLYEIKEIGLNWFGNDTSNEGFKNSETVILNDSSTISDYETYFRRKISSDDRYSFIGNYAREFSDELYELISNQIGNYRTVNGYINLLKKHPAIFSIYLAREIARLTGQTNGTLEIYPILAQTLKLSSNDISVEHRTVLWKAFRQACIALGLNVSPRTEGNLYMSDEYLLKAGIPDAFLPDLVRKVFQLARQIGLPSSDDSEEMSRWQDILIYQLVPPFPQTVTRFLKLDRNCFYLTAIKKIFEGKEPAADWENVIHQEIENIPNNNNPKSIGVPFLNYRDGQIGIVIQPCGNTAWDIDIRSIDEDIISTNYESTHWEMFIPLDWYPLAKLVKLVKKDSDFEHSLSVWEDERNNRFLLFTKNGEFITSSSLGDLEQILQVAPNEYFLISRFEPLNLEAHQLSHMPEIFCSEFTLSSGSSICIANNGFTLQAFKSESCEWLGVSVISLEGDEVFASTGLKVKISLPDDCVYQLVMSTPNQTNIQWEIADSGAQINLFDASNSWSPAVRKVKLTLNKQNKKIASWSRWVWIGLMRVENLSIFHFVNSPLNFNPNTSKHVTRYDNRIEASTAEPWFSIAFDLPRLTLSWRKPVLYLELEDRVDGIVNTNCINIGSHVSVTHSSQRSLNIYHYLEGEVIFNDLCQKVNFDKSGHYKLPLANLLGWTENGTGTLQYRSPQGNLVDLIQLTPPSIMGFNVNYVNNQRINIQLTCTNPLVNVVLKIKNISNNKCFIIPIGHTPEAIQLRLGGAVHLAGEMENINTWNYKIAIFEANLWDDGVWFIDIESGSQNNHQALRTIAGYKIGFSLIVSGKVMLNDYNIEFHNIYLLLNNITYILWQCYDDGQSGSLRLLSNIWRRLIDKIVLDEREIKRLLELIHAIPTDQSIGVFNRSPNIIFYKNVLLAQSSDCYENIDDRGRPLLSCLKLLGAADSVDFENEHYNKFYDNFRRRQDSHDVVDASNGRLLCITLFRLIRQNINNFRWNNYNLIFMQHNDEFLDDLERLISALALASRLQARYEHTYLAYIEREAIERGINFSLAINYISIVGEDLLGFYLLYWERNIN
jgi:hypothetical protein